jgi:hypothetical protein
MSVLFIGTIRRIIRAYDCVRLFQHLSEFSSWVKQTNAIDETYLKLQIIYLENTQNWITLGYEAAGLNCDIRCFVNKICADRTYGF